MIIAPTIAECGAPSKAPIIPQRRTYRANSLPRRRWTSWRGLSVNAVRSGPRAPAFHLAATCLFFKALSFLRNRCSRSYTLFRRRRRPFNERRETCARVLPVAGLIAKPRGFYQNYAVFRRPRAGEFQQTTSNAIRKGARSHRVESQLNCACDLVYVLPAWPGGANETLLYLFFVDEERAGAHQPWVASRRAFNLALARSLTLSDFSCPQAAEMSRPRGVLIGEA